MFVVFRYGHFACALDSPFGFFRTGLALSGQPARDSLPGLTLTGAVDLWVPNSEVASGIDEYDVVGRIGLNWSL